MFDISGKFRSWLLEKDKWGLYKRGGELCHDTLEIGFYHGYMIAKKEVEQQILDAENVIKEYTKFSGYTLEVTDKYWEKYERNNN